MRVDRRAVGDLATGVAALAGVVAAGSPASPTGRPAVDAVLVGVAVGIVSLVATRAPWWTVALLAATALGIAADPVLIVLAAVAVAGAVASRTAPRVRPAALAASAGLALNVAARGELGGPLGLSAAIAVVAAAVVFVAGLRRCTRRVRRLAWAGTGLAVVAAGAATAGFGLAAASSRADLSAGLRAAEAAVAALERGDFERAAAEFRDAAELLDGAHAELSEPYAAAAAFVPVVAQHLSAAVDMSAAGAEGAAVVADAVEQIDLDALRVSGGRIDLDALAALRSPFERVRTALVDLGATARDVQSPWLVTRARRELDDFEVSVAEHLPSLDQAIDTVDLAPGMLGAERAQRYLVLSTTPAESRGLGGVVVSFAELTVDDGRLSVSRFGPAHALDRAVAEARIRIDEPAGFVARYGRFGLGGGAAGTAVFRTLMMTPHFPWAAEVAADVYARTTGRAVDGVIALDPLVVAALLRYTGPIDLRTLDAVIDAGNAADLLLREQYVLAGDHTGRRIDAIVEVAWRTFAAALAGTLPAPTTLADDLGPLARERRLLVWSPEAAEQDLLSRVGLGGEIPSLDGRDGWSFAVNNGGGNKIDAYLQRAASYTSTTDPATGVTSATLRIELTNTAPPAGLPDAVIGNGAGLPRGSSRLYVAAYSALALESLTVDGEAVTAEAGVEQGWNVYAREVDIPAGGTVRLELQLTGQLSRPGEVVTWTQPLATPLAPL